jgi:predicted CXXCH cytochrome family protein
MNPRAVVLLLALAAPALALPAAPKQQTYKLKPGAEGKLCLDCHPQLEDVLKKAFVHTPVKSRNCAGCHNPHASKHGKLLSAEGGAVCTACHPNVVPAEAKSTHKPVSDGTCSKCHDPHASGFKANLVRGANDLCAGCHEKVAGAAAKAKFPHKPVVDSCVACHDPLGSAKGGKILKADVPALCVGCHKTDRQVFAKQHGNYPVAKADCTSCHDAHGSSQRGMLKDTVHPPVAKQGCAQCHNPAGSPDALATKSSGAQLCRGCHAQKLTAFNDRSRVHRPVADGDCLACHGPHASKEKGLLKASTLTVCGSCHADTVKRQALSVTPHEPIRDGKCTACHDPHSSDAALAFVKAEVVDTCGTCHDWLKHSSHPMGKEVVDPRNRNLSTQCLSCHRSHGTEYKHLIPYPTTSALCTKCHETFKR